MRLGVTVYAGLLSALRLTCQAESGIVGTAGIGEQTIVSAPAKVSAAARYRSGGGTGTARKARHFRRQCRRSIASCFNRNGYIF